MSAGPLWVPPQPVSPVQEAWWPGPKVRLDASLKGAGSLLYSAASGRLNPSCSGHTIVGSWVCGPQSVGVRQVAARHLD